MTHLPPNHPATTIQISPTIHPPRYSPSPPLPIPTFTIGALNVKAENANGSNAAKLVNFEGMRQYILPSDVEFNLTPTHRSYVDLSTVFGVAA